MKAVIYNLGCKVNQYEGYSMGNILKKAGYDVSYELQPADVFIINSCAVTKEAERKSAQTVAKIKKINPLAKIIVCGCASQKYGEQFLKKEVSFVFGTANKGSIANLLNRQGYNIFGLPSVYEDDLEQKTYRTRAYIKVQDGCDNFCSYCIVPYLRGRSRSRSLESIKKEIFAVKECNEIVITGINLSDYGKNIKLTLSDLIKSLIDVDKRIRLGSLEVNVIDDKLLTSLKELKMFCPHFHLSLQSGADSVLKRMNRHYTCEEFLNKVMKIREYFPLAAITTDIITGFPMESEEEFQQSLNFVEKIGFAAAHVFPYSVREGTMAAKMEQVPKPIRTQRAKILTESVALSEKRYLKSFIGQTLEMLSEEYKNDFTIGHTREYIKVYLKGKFPHNKLLNVKIGNLYEDGVMAVLTQE